MTNISIFGTAKAALLVELDIYAPDILETTPPDAVLPFVLEGFFELRTSSNRRDLAELLGFNAAHPETYMLDLAKVDMSPHSELQELLDRSGESDQISYVQKLLAGATTHQTIIQR